MHDLFPLLKCREITLELVCTIKFCMIINPGAPKSSCVLVSNYFLCLLLLLSSCLIY